MGILNTSIIGQSPLATTLHVSSLKYLWKMWRAPSGKPKHNTMFSFASFSTSFRGVPVIIPQFKPWRLEGDVTVQTKKMIDIHHICADKWMHVRNAWCTELHSSLSYYFCICLIWDFFFFFNTVSSNLALFYMTFLINSPLFCCEALAAKDRMNTANSYLMFTFKLFGFWHRFETLILLGFITLNDENCLRMWCPLEIPEFSADLSLCSCSCSYL